MSNVYPALGANLATTVSGNAAGTVYYFPPGTYYGQGWSPQVGDLYYGDSSGLTKISGAWVVTSWSGSGSTYKATQGLSDLNGATQTTFPTTDSIYTSITGYISGTTLTVSSTVRGAVANGSVIWDAGGVTAAGTQLTGGSGTSWTVSTSQTVGSSGSPVTFYLTQSQNVFASQFPFCAFAEDLYVSGVRYSRMAAPGPAIANSWWLNPSDKSINVNVNLGATVASWTAGTVSGNTLTVGGSVTGTIAVPCIVTGTSLTAGTQIIAYGTGTGGAGTYILNHSFTISSEAMATQALVEYSIVQSFASNNFVACDWHNITFDKWAPLGQGGYGVLANCANYTMENCTFSNIHNSATYGSPNTFTNCKFLYCGGGPGASSGRSLKIIDCEIAYGNWSGNSILNSAAGIKIVQMWDVLIDGCRVHDNAGMGIWFDIESSGVVITNNIVYNNSSAAQYSGGVTGAANGIMIEICKGNTVVADNVVYNNSGAGIYIANSSGVEVYGNLVTVGPANANIFTDLTTGGICVVNYSRGGDGNNIPYELRNINIHDNTVIHTTDTASDGMLISQAIAGNPNIVWNNNTYITPNNTTQWWEFDSTAGGGYAFYTWAALQTAGVYETTGQNLIGTPVNYATIMGSLGDYRNLLMAIVANPPGMKAPFRE
jgi:parallel beta-helix repeat protein